MSSSLWKVLCGPIVLAVIASGLMMAGACAESTTLPLADAGAGDGFQYDPTDSNSGADGNSACGPNACEIGESRCAGPKQVVRCASAANGCGSFQSPVDCPTDHSCVNGRCLKDGACSDMDGDGFGKGCPKGPDCDDSDRSVNPDATETCGDNIDNNCANGADEGCGSSCMNQACTPGNTQCLSGGKVEVCQTDANGCGVWSSPMPCPSGQCSGGKCANCTDNDGDGYGKNCPAGSDCNDGNRDIHMGAKELCDGLDNDCDSQTDEDFPNLGGSCTAGTGVCESSGNVVCDSSGNGTTCDATPGQGGTEKCGDNKDNNCDGSTDEGFGVVGQSCTRNKGVCESQGTFQCDPNNPTKTYCDAPDKSNKSTSETCDNKDNDCDGSTDEDGVCNQCVEDQYEENDSSPTGTNLKSAKTIKNIMSCGKCPSQGSADRDWFVLGSQPSGTSIKVTLKHPTGTNAKGNQYADLDAEMYCGSNICDSIRGTSGTTSTTFSDNCPTGNSCPSGSVWAFYVYPRCNLNPQGNPKTGTPYEVTRH